MKDQYRVEKSQITLNNKPVTHFKIYELDDNSYIYAGSGVAKKRASDGDCVEEHETQMQFMAENGSGQDGDDY